MIGGGFVVIRRALLEHPAFRNEGEAMQFAWMIARAAWKPTAGPPLQLLHGQRMHRRWFAYGDLEPARRSESLDPPILFQSRQAESGCLIQRLRFDVDAVTDPGSALETDRAKP